MSGEDCLLHFPSWLIHLGGDRRFLYPDTVLDIAQKEGSGGPRPVASQAHCVCRLLDLLCEPVMMLHSEGDVSYQCLTNNCASDRWSVVRNRSCLICHQ